MWTVPRKEQDQEEADDDGGAARGEGSISSSPSRSVGSMQHGSTSTSAAALTMLQAPLLGSTRHEDDAAQTLAVSVSAAVSRSSV